MKKILSTLCMTLIAVVMMGQQPVLTFEKLEHDFGEVREEDGRVSAVFTFKNEGMAPLILNNVTASCGCTVPSWPREPIEPGQTSSITVTYNANGRPGKIDKRITVRSNASEPVQYLHIFGTVKAKQVKPASKYSIAVGDLRMKSKTLDLGAIKKGEMMSGELEYSNETQAAHTVELAISAADAGFIHQITLPTIQPNEVGKCIFAIDTKKTKLYGPVEFNAYLVIDGKRLIENTYKLTVKADIVEDFSQLTLGDKQSAPIIEVPAEVNVGSVTAGKVLKAYIPVKNIGFNPLEIRRVYCSDPMITTKGCRAIRSSKKGAVALDIRTEGLQPGKYSRQIILVNNDYEHSRQKVTVKWTVE